VRRVRWQRSGSATLLLGASCALALVMSGCAGTSGWAFTEDVGVPAVVERAGGERLAGTLVELSDGDLLVETEIERGENVEVVRKDGIDYVYVDGIVLGTAVDVRDFDIVTRRRIPLRSAERLTVESGGYLGWGSAIAGVLSFFLMQVLEEE